MSRKLIGDYELASVIGHGATGRVWRARHRQTGAEVAVKVLRGEYADDPKARARFLSEARLLIERPLTGAVRVLEEIDDPEAPAIVMELVEAPTLREVLSKEAPLAPARATRLVCALTTTLAAAHAAGLVHGDVKPENVMVRTRGKDGGIDEETILMDFGLARVLEDSSAAQSRSQVIGTPHYAAPEIHSGEKTKAPADVYAVGVMLYEAIVGRRPFDAPTTLGVIQKHLSADPARTADFSHPLWDTVAACLAKDPAARPAAVNLAGQLTRILDEGLLQPEALATAQWQRTPPSPTASGGRRRPWPVIAASVASVALVAGSTTYAVARNGLLGSPTAAITDQIEPVGTPGPQSPSTSTATTATTPATSTSVSAPPSGPVGVPIPEPPQPPPADSAPKGQAPDADPRPQQPPPKQPEKPEDPGPASIITRTVPKPPEPKPPIETFPQVLEVPNRCTAGNTSFEVRWVVTRTKDTHIWQRAYVKINAPKSMGRQMVRLHLWESGTDRIMLPFRIPVNESQVVNLGNVVTQRKNTETRGVIWLKGDSSRDGYCGDATKW